MNSGPWALNERLPSEQALMKELGVSRGTLLEALKSLAHAGMMEVRRGDGTQAVRLAAPHAGTADVDLMRTQPAGPASWQVLDETRATACTTCRIRACASLAVACRLS
nr:winged helix-turn-helix domain-containing protein [Arthrobacter sp. AQ5-05]